MKLIIAIIKPDRLEAVKQELYKVKTMIRKVDPDAFVILCDATEVLGQGFKSENISHK